MEIGSKIKRLRLQLSLTQSELAGRCELTKGYISQLENDLTSPSISTLIDILSALGTDAQTFFKEEEEEQVVFTENDFIVKDSLEQEKIWLVPNCQKNEMEPLLVTIKPKYSLPSDMPHEGEEFGYVLSGKIILHLGKNSYTVKAKESFYFVSDKLHYIENASNIPAKIIWISSPPTF